MIRLRIILLLLLFKLPVVFSQDTTIIWDSWKKSWPGQCFRFEIPSSIDGELQPVIVYPSAGVKKMPLVVSLHTWSNGYDQYDPLAKQCIEKNFNYIHPHFRGPNTHFKACGSEYVIQDLEDAITWAMDNLNVDTSEIHVIGTSGGGYATLLSYMTTRHYVKTFSAWVPLSDLVRWYYESEGRATKYAFDIARSTVEENNFSKENYYMNEKEAIKRSPMYMNTPVERRKNSKLYIFSGIHDGYTGSVPISQSLLFYNKLVQDFDPSDSISLIPTEDIIEMLSSRMYWPELSESIGERKLHYKKNYKGLIQVNVFEGGHEMIESVALDPLNSEKILAIGDSNGAMENGWVAQLVKINFRDFIYNTSIAGNTIGFDNNGRSELNTLKNIQIYLQLGAEALGGLDKILILLGTNDTKYVFKDSIQEVGKKMTELIKNIKSDSVYNLYKPEIIIISPPPIGKKADSGSKYHGSSERLPLLNSIFENIAHSEGLGYLDIQTCLNSMWESLSKDGIHGDTGAQRIIAGCISDFLE
jgi:lysophospholipase L1-like esterase